MRRTLRTHLLSSWAWLQEEKERAVHDEDQPSYFWRAHTGTVLIVLLCVLVYTALVGKGRGPYRPKGILLLSVSIVLSIQMHFCLYLDLRIRLHTVIKFYVFYTYVEEKIFSNFMSRHKMSNSRNVQNRNLKPFINHRCCHCCVATAAWSGGKQASPAAA